MSSWQKKHYQSVYKTGRSRSRKVEVIKDVEYKVGIDYTPSIGKSKGNFKKLVPKNDTDFICRIPTLEKKVN